MKRTLSFAVLFCAACTEQQPLTSVDGLSGGELTTAIKAPAVEAGEVTTTSVSASHVDSETVVATEVDAQSVRVDSLTVRGLSVFGQPVGVVNFSSITNGQGYRAADEQCSVAFGELAHVCSAQEAVVAFRSGADIADAFHGAGVVTNSFFVAAQDDSGDGALTGRLFVVNDCDGWSSSRQFGETRVDDGNEENPSRSNLGSGRVTNWTDSYMVMFKGPSESPSWRLRPNIDGCVEVRLACCG